MARSDEYRRHAENCLRLARESSPESRGFLIMMAEAWHKLAQDQERVERSTEDTSEPSQ
jgi:hypothetical protein